MEPGVIYCEASVGSKEFKDLIKNRYGLRTAVETFRSGDFAFRCGHTEPNPFCNGEYGCKIAIERKALSDCIGSMLKGRLRKQVADLLVDYTQSWILVEGIYRPGQDDIIEILDWKGRWRASSYGLTWSQLSGWLTRYEVMGMGKIHTWKTSTRYETAAWVAATWRWWQKEWKKHSPEAIEKMPNPIQALTWRALQIHKTAASLPEVGIKSCKRVGKYFKSIREMINADEDEWIKALRGDGLTVVDRKVAARTIVKAIEKEYR